MNPNIKKFIVPAAVVAFALAAYFSLAPDAAAPTDGPMGVREPVAAPMPAGKLAAPENDLISVSAPMPGAFVTSPLTVTGQARGYWYFEASFPVKLLDQDGSVLATAPAQAQGEWMTEDFVPFSVTLTYPTPQGQYGTLVLMKDNPSGEPQNDNQISFPVVFDPNYVPQW
jgi:hypothetical protein